MKVKDCDISDRYPKSQKTETIDIVAKKMKGSHEFNHSIVLENGKPVGIVSIRDILEKVVAMGKNCSQVTVSEIMTSPVVTAKMEDDLRTVSQTMTDRHFLSMPVVDNKGKYVGLVSIYDVLGKLRESHKE
jgi:CBS domain-containing protein